MPSLVRLLGAFAPCALALACGARTNLGGATDASADAAGATFPVGTYTSCAFGTVSPGISLAPSGFDDGATLTVAASGDARTATYSDNNGQYTWSFSPTTSESAGLAPSPQTTGGFAQSICVYGVGVSNEKFFPTTFVTASGAMTYQSGAVFLALEGELTSHTDCGDVAAPAAVWIGCTGGPAPPVTTPPSASSFPVGGYACTSQVGTHTTINGQNTFVSSGGNGALVLTQAGAQVTAHYDGDPDLTGALELTLDAAGDGRAVAGQTVTARCGLSAATGDLSVTSASLTAEGGTVFLSFAGTMSTSGACSGGEKIAALVCAAK